MQARSGLPVENQIYNEIGKCGEMIAPHKRKEENRVQRFGAEQPWSVVSERLQEPYRKCKCSQKAGTGSSNQGFHTVQLQKASCIPV